MVDSQISDFLPREATNLAKQMGRNPSPPLQYGKYSTASIKTNSDLQCGNNSIDWTTIMDGSEFSDPEI